MAQATTSEQFNLFNEFIVFFYYFIFSICVAECGCRAFSAVDGGVLQSCAMSKNKMNDAHIYVLNFHCLSFFGVRVSEC